MNNKNKIKQSDQQYVFETKIQEPDYNHVENLKNKSEKKIFNTDSNKQTKKEKKGET